MAVSESLHAGYAIPSGPSAARWTLIHTTLSGVTGVRRARPVSLVGLGDSAGKAFRKFYTRTRSFSMVVCHDQRRESWKMNFCSSENVSAMEAARLVSMHCASIYIRRSSVRTGARRCVMGTLEEMHILVHLAKLASEIWRNQTWSLLDSLVIFAGIACIRCRKHP